MAALDGSSWLGGLVAAAILRGSWQSASSKDLAAAPQKGYSKGMTLMKLPEQEHERIREDELVRLQVRKDVKQMRRPRLILFALLWTAALTALAFLGPRVH